MVAITLPPLRDALALVPPTPVTSIFTLPPIVNLHKGAKHDILLNNKYPAIMDRILAHLPLRDLRALQNTCTALRHRLDTLSSRCMWLSHTSTGELSLKSFLGTRAKLPLWILNDPRASANIRLLDTSGFNDTRAIRWAHTHLAPPPNLQVINISETSLVLPAPMAIQHSPVYPTHSGQLAGHMVPFLNPGICAARIPHVTWILEAEHPDDLRYARLDPDFCIPPTVKHLTVLVVPARSTQVPREAVVWLKPLQDGRFWPVPVKPEAVAEAVPGCQFVGRDAFLAPEYRGDLSLFAELAMAAAEALHRPTIQLAGTAAWPGAWVTRDGAPLSFQNKFLSVYSRRLLQAVLDDRQAIDWAAVCSNIVFTGAEDVAAKRVIRSIIPPAWEK
jgi:hypothetical protein